MPFLQAFCLRGVLGPSKRGGRPEGEAGAGPASREEDPEAPGGAGGAPEAGAGEGWLAAKVLGECPRSSNPRVAKLPAFAALHFIASVVVHDARAFFTTAPRHRGGGGAGGGLVLAALLAAKYACWGAALSARPGRDGAGALEPAGGGRGPAPAAGGDQGGA